MPILGFQSSKDFDKKYVFVEVEIFQSYICLSFTQFPFHESPIGSTLIRYVLPIIQVYIAQIPGLYTMTPEIQNRDKSTMWPLYVLLHFSHRQITIISAEVGSSVGNSNSMICRKAVALGLFPRTFESCTLSRVYMKWYVLYIFKVILWKGLCIFFFVDENHSRWHISSNEIRYTNRNFMIFIFAAKCLGIHTSTISSLNLKTLVVALMQTKPVSLD